ncbi:type II secretion system GspH family protein [Akkermansiaceae bacterium]|nr:type II secretion system GspH family protein [Akkermansiaceae bacterium]
MDEISTGRVKISGLFYGNETTTAYLMKTHISPLSTRKGFTLVELLVVIAIIAILATMAVAGARIAKDAAANAGARAAIADLTNALDAFYDDQDAFPLSEGQDEDSEVTTDSQLMNILTGIDTDENPQGNSYFTFKKAKGNNNNYWDGLYRTASTAELYGPWKNRNKNDRFYRVIFNYDYDEFIREPSSTGGSEEIYGYKYLIYHAGKDGEVGGEENVDNLYNWK